MNLKFLYPLIGFSIGIFLASEIFTRIWFCGICFGLALIVWISIQIFSKNPIKRFIYSKFHSIWIILLFSGLGSLDYILFSKPYIETDINNKNLSFTGEIEKINTLSDGDKFKLRIYNVTDSSGKSIGIRNLDMVLKTNGYVGNVGDIVTFKTKAINLISSSKNKDYINRMRHQGIDLYASVKADNIIKQNQKFSIYSYFSDLKDKIIIKIEKSSLNRSTSDFIISIVLGDKSFLSSETKETLSSVGLAHVLALSGMHVAIILSIILTLLFPLSLFGYVKTRQIIAVILVWLYVFLTGASPSTVRAAIMITLIMGALIMERKNSALNALFAAVLIILLLNPLALWNIGLQLSAICVASIIIFTNPLNPIDHHKHPKIYNIVNITLVTLITTFCTWSLIAYYFKNVPLLFLPVNVLLLPVIPCFISLSIVFIIFLVIGKDFTALSRSLDFFNDLIIKVCNFFSFDGHTRMTVELPYQSVMLWLIGITLLAICFHTVGIKKKKLVAFTASIAIVISLSLPLFNENSSSIKVIHSLTKIEAHYKKNQKMTRLIFPRGKISKSVCDEINILSIDNYILADSLNSFKTNNLNKSNCLLVGPGANLEQIAEIINDSSFSNIILHSGIGKKKKADLISLLNENHIENVYSLRDNGSLEFDL